MNNVSLQFAGIKDLKGAVKGAVAKQVTGENLADQGAKLVGLLEKAGIKDAETLNTLTEGLQSVSPSDVFGAAEAIATAKLGEGTVAAVKQVAGGNTEILEKGLEEAGTRAGNVLTAVNDNLGTTAATVLAKGAGLVMLGLQKAAQLAAATPVLVPQALEAAEGFVQPAADQLGQSLEKKAEKALQEAALANSAKAALPGLSNKAGELLKAAKALFQATEAEAPTGAAAELAALMAKAQSGAKLSLDESARLLELLQQ